MKMTILLILLTCGCFVSTYSQINQKHKRDTSVNNPFRFHYDIKPGLEYKNLNDKTVDGFLSFDSQYKSWEQEKTFAQDNMPCFKPEGVFSMRIIKPDPTMKYTMLLKK